MAAETNHSNTLVYPDLICMPLLPDALCLVPPQISRIDFCIFLEELGYSAERLGVINRVLDYICQDSIHGKDVRKDGRSYVEGHLLPVAALAAFYTPSTDKLIVEGALLHDASEASEIPVAAITGELELPELEPILEALTKPLKSAFHGVTPAKNKSQRNSAYYHQLKHAVATFKPAEARALGTIKCCDNLMNFFDDMARLLTGDLNSSQLQWIKEYISSCTTMYNHIIAFAGEELHQLWKSVSNTNKMLVSAYLENMIPENVPLAV